MSQVILSVKDLVMRFGGLLAVDQVAFDVNKNEIFSIIGPNGAGKTTLLRMIAGIMTPSGGSITIDNLNYHDNEIEIKKRIAFLTGNTKLYKDLSAYELLTMCGNYYHMSKKDIKDRIKYFVSF